MATRRDGKAPNPRHARLRKEAVASLKSVFWAIAPIAGDALTTKWAESVVDDLTDYILEVVCIETEARTRLKARKGRKG